MYKPHPILLKNLLATFGSILTYDPYVSMDQTYGSWSYPASKPMISHMGPGGAHTGSAWEIMGLSTGY